jgi:hypothetical protein
MKFAKTFSDLKTASWNPRFTHHRSSTHGVPMCVTSLQTYLMSVCRHCNDKTDQLISTVGQLCHCILSYIPIGTPVSLPPFYKTCFISSFVLCWVPGHSELPCFMEIQRSSMPRQFCQCSLFRNSHIRFCSWQPMVRLYQVTLSMKIYINRCLGVKNKCFL